MGTNDALALFGNKDAKGIVLLKPYAEYYGEYEKRVADLITGFPLAAAAVTGAAANGRILWRLPDGRTYAEWEEAENASSASDAIVQD